MDRSGDFARRARHTAIGHEGDLEPLVLQHAERRRKFVKLRHAVGVGALKADDDDDVSVEVARLERGQHVILVGKDGAGRFDNEARGLHGACLDDGATEIAGQQAHPAVGREGVAGGPHHRGVARHGDGGLPHQRIVDEDRFIAIVREVGPRDGHDVTVEEAGIEQFADNEPDATGVVEVVHITRAIGINPRQHRNGRRQLVEIFPVDDDAGGAGNRGQVDRVVGRTARGEQTDAGVDDGFFIDAVAQGAVVLAVPCDRGEAVGCGTGEFAAQFRAGIDERAAGHVEAHDFHHHLV